MLFPVLKTCDCSCGDIKHVSSGDGLLQMLSSVAARLHATLQVADFLTEKPELTETDIIALDVLLESGRDSTCELVNLIELLSESTGPAPTEAQPRC